MRTATKLLLIVLASTLLVSCFGGNGDDAANKAPVASEEDRRIENSKEVKEEQARIGKLNTLTSENLNTQVEKKDGKKVLKDRRLFVNYIKSEKVGSSKGLISALGRVEEFAKKNGVVLQESDILVLIAGSQIENPNWDICGDFNITKKSLDSKNKFYIYINNLCNPMVTSPTAKK